MKTDQKRGVIGLGFTAIFAVGLCTVLASREDPPPPPDEDAYVDALFTSKWDVLLPKRPFIDEGYEACELLRSGRTEEEAALIMSNRDINASNQSSIRAEKQGYIVTPVEPEAVREKYRQQTVAAHAYLCADA
ncbi:hypothetical protein FEZ60_25060 [Rhodococcus sp. MS16]|uniref:hypothetical protein n=1 Tax=Rhodococcus sp. MS16 TaxID=2579941 RepID=UPI001562C5A5|nr:hypothetical protein [Rhodococcus sp. MS16]NRI68794.1 hypothetical protein [Rhodococcus sp. MS16]